MHLNQFLGSWCLRVEVFTSIHLVRALVVVVFTLCITAPAHAQAVLGPGGYTENFNSMGAGTAPPLGWGVHSIAGASGTWTNSTGSNSVPAVGAIPNGTTVAGGASVALVVNDNPTASGSYNALGASAVAGDRGIATAPTGTNGNAIQLQISNNTGLGLTALQLSYDMRRYRVGADDPGRNPPAGIPQGSEELPGYWLFYSLDNGVNYTAVNSLIPVGAGPSAQPIVPNTLGVTSVSNALVTLGGTWNNGSNLYLRWVDDNAIDPSPDEIIGLDNVSITPEPSSLILLVASALLAGRVRRLA